LSLSVPRPLRRNDSGPAIRKRSVEVAYQLIAETRSHDVHVAQGAPVAARARDVFRTIEQVDQDLRPGVILKADLRKEDQTLREQSRRIGAFCDFDRSCGQ
jgi:hypothetical protein